VAGRMSAGEKNYAALNTHHLEADSHILKEQRFDPITGEVLKAGDKVVFCAACHSAFLDDSWEYIGGEHCNQSATLLYPPIPQEVLALEKREVYPPIYKTMWEPYSGVRWEQASKLIFAVFIGLMLSQAMRRLGQPDSKYTANRITFTPSTYTKSPRPKLPIQVLSTEKLQASNELMLNGVYYGLRETKAGKLVLSPRGERVDGDYILDQKDNILLRSDGFQVQLLQIQTAKSELLPITEWLDFSMESVEIKSLSLSYDYSKATITTKEGLVFLFDFNEKRTLKRWLLSPSAEAVWLPLHDGSWDSILALDDGKGDVQLYDTQKKTFQKAFSYLEDHQVRLSPSGDSYLIASPNGKIQVHSLRLGMLKGIFAIDDSTNASISKVDFSTDGKYIVASGTTSGIYQEENKSFTAIWELSSLPTFP
ncbi:MAG: WD40 repeat domain-containing protein, partial [Bacteroidota bacterium]